MNGSTSLPKRRMIPNDRKWTVSQHFMKSLVIRHLGSSVGLVTVRAAIQFTHDHAGDAVTQRGDGVWIVPRRPCRLRRGVEGGKGFARTRGSRTPPDTG